MKLSLYLLFFSSLILSSTSQASTLDVSKLRFPVTKTVLTNGLTVLMHVDHSVPTISYQTWFRVGSKYEDPGFTGIAHLFEHMMFKGAKRYTGKEFDQLLQANGITNNAFTTYDYTGYYEDLPSSKLQMVIDIESDRMVNLALTPENLKSEREVVKEERRWRVDNSVTGSMNEVLWSTAYKVHPYKWPVIGWMTDIDALTLERCRAFYHTYYSPANAVVTIVGDFDPVVAMGLINKYYGDLPKVVVPKRELASEPPQTAPRDASMSKVAQTGYVAMAYHTVKQGESDGYVLDLIANILAEGDSSRLYKKLVYRDQKALGVDASSITPQDPGVFEFSVELKPGVPAKPIIGQIQMELAKLADEKVNPLELEKAKNQTMKHWVDSLKRIHDKAYILILNEIVTGSYTNLFDDLEKYDKVTPEDVQRVARKYFTKNNMTALTLIPEAPKTTEREHQ
jgi:zinc protease